MDIIQLLFRLLLDFVPFQEGEFAKLKGEAETWYASIKSDDESFKEADGKDLLMMKFKKATGTWQARTAGAVLYLVFKRKIKQAMEAPFESEEPEQEEKGLF
jgi:hypothetical protein